jgi:hypothetical protein
MGHLRGKKKSKNDPQTPCSPNKILQNQRLRFFFDIISPSKRLLKTRISSNLVKYTVSDVKRKYRDKF